MSGMRPDPEEPQFVALKILVRESHRIAAVHSEMTLDTSGKGLSPSVVRQNRAVARELRRLADRLDLIAANSTPLEMERFFAGI